jgi:diguanylate cyclase (GGDEF)-like protein
MAMAPGPQTTARGVITIGVMLMIIVSLMLSEQRTRSLARLNRRLAYTDPLTHIANTRRLREDLSDALVRFESDGEQFALFAMDLDNFKLVNDVFDHGMGDRVLQAVAREISAEIAPGDLVARRGGDEFSALIANAANRDLDELRDRLSGAIARARTEVCPSITPSGGVAYIRVREGDGLASTLQRADDELHDVKSAYHRKHGSRDSIGLIDISRDTLQELQLRDVDVDPSEVDPDAPKVVARLSSRLRTATLLGLNPLWSFAVFTFTPIGLVVGTLCLFGLLKPLSPLAGAAINSGFVALGVLSLIAGFRSASLKLLHPIFATAIALLTLQVVLAGDAGGSLIDLYAVLMLFAFHFFAPRMALPYALTSMGLFTGFAIGGGFVDATPRVAVTMTVLLVGIGLVVKVRGITVGYARKNQEMSEVDALTGVSNVRALRSRVSTAVHDAAADGPRPVLISLDLDKFKHVNDTYNHTVGDQVLVAVARAISETVRADDFVARRGGDEFVILCAFSEPNELHNLIPRLSAAITHARMRICPDLTSSASITAVAWESGEDAETFLERSDVALHDAKLATRARGYEASA